MCSTELDSGCIGLECPDVDSKMYKGSVMSRFCGSASLLIEGCAGTTYAVSAIVSGGPAPPWASSAHGPRPNDQFHKKCIDFQSSNIHKMKIFLDPLMSYLSKLQVSLASLHEVVNNHPLQEVLKHYQMLLSLMVIFL